MTPTTPVCPPHRGFVAVPAAPEPEPDLSAWEALILLMLAVASYLVYRNILLFAFPREQFWSILS